MLTTNYIDSFHQAKLHRIPWSISLNIHSIISNLACKGIWFFICCAMSVMCMNKMHVKHFSQHRTCIDLPFNGYSLCFIQCLDWRGSMSWSVADEARFLLIYLLADISLIFIWCHRKKYWIGLHITPLVLMPKYTCSVQRLLMTRLLVLPGYQQTFDWQCGIP